MIDRDKLYLTHIAECIEHIEEYTAPGSDHFMTSRLTQDAVMRNFEIIGEAVRNLSGKTLDRTPDIPWPRITAFRNVLIHGYFKVDLEQVWNVIENDLPDLKEAVNYLLK